MPPAKSEPNQILCADMGAGIDLQNGSMGNAFDLCQIPVRLNVVTISFKAAVAALKY